MSRRRTRHALLVWFYYYCWLFQLNALFTAARQVPLAVASLPSRKKQWRNNQTQQQQSSSSSSSSPENESFTAGLLDGMKNGLASALAAACVKTTLQPIDALKTMQQYHQASCGKSLSVIEAGREIVRAGGIGNFYSGLSVTVIGSMPGVALYFGVYSYLKRLFLQTERGKNNKTASIALAAAIGNSVASFSRVPYEVLKQKLQTKAYASTWEALQAVAREWTLLFPKGGVAIQILRDVPYAVITLLLYESLQASYKATQQQRQQQQGSSDTRVGDFFIGGIAGGMGSWITNPMDVIKTRLQTNSESYNGSVQACAVAIYQEGGPAAFLRGSVPRLMHKIPANAFFFLFYEFFRRALRVKEISEKQK